MGGTWTACGKTSVVELLLRALPGWGALKITPSRPDEPCPTGHECGACAPPLGPWELVTAGSRLAEAGKDTARFLAAGAPRVRWLRALPERLPEALGVALAEFQDLPGVIVESTTVLPSLQGRRMLIERPGTARRKPSAQVAESCVDGVVLNVTVNDPEPPGRLVVCPPLGPGHPRNAAFLAWATR